jgi:bifunctional ADP-heptose synthase (sugar kinase/adenylyltransferase)
VSDYLDILTPEARDFLAAFARRDPVPTLLETLRRLSDLRVLVVGETIIDEYRFCTTLGKSSKEPILAVRHNYGEQYAGGILAVANHLAGFCGRVTCATALGDEPSHEEFIAAHLSPRVSPLYLRQERTPTITKIRLLEEYLGTKLIEVYHMRGDDLTHAEERRFLAMLEEQLPRHDLVVVADYGHGLMTEKVIEFLCEKAPFLAVNAQTNAGNRGFNFVSKYPRADYISIDEPEARLEVRNRNMEIGYVLPILAERIDCPVFMVTRGKNGCLCYRPAGPAGAEEVVSVPALAIKMVDRIGAGDALLALTSPLVHLGVPLEQVAFLGNVAGAEACATMGNKAPVTFDGMAEHVRRLLG